jgi:uncharacterized iron-regulated membrane protein
MFRYWYVWTPFVIVGTVVFLSLPWLGPIALMVVSLFVVVALAGAVVWVAHLLTWAISRGLHARPGTSQRPAAILSPANSVVRSTRSAPAGAAGSLPTALPKGTDDMSTVTARRRPAKSRRHQPDGRVVETRPGSQCGARRCLREQPCSAISCRAGRTHLV